MHLKILLVLAGPGVMPKDLQGVRLQVARPMPHLPMVRGLLPTMGRPLQPDARHLCG